MLGTTLSIFSVTLVLGLILSSRVLEGMRASWIVSIGHISLGACGFMLLIYSLTLGPLNPEILLVTTALLFVAICLGLFLAYKHYRQQTPKLGVAFAHIGCALSGIIVMLYGMWF